MVQCLINIHLCAHIAPNTYSFIKIWQNLCSYSLIQANKIKNCCLHSNKNKSVFSVENSKVTWRDSNIITKCVSCIQKAYEWLKIGGICNECTDYTQFHVWMCALASSHLITVCRTCKRKLTCTNYNNLIYLQTFKDTQSSIWHPITLI